MGEDRPRPTVSGEKGKGRKFCRASIDSLDDVLFFFLFLEIPSSLRFASREGEREGGDVRIEMAEIGRREGREGREGGRNLVRGETVRPLSTAAPVCVRPSWCRLGLIRPSVLPCSIHPTTNRNLSANLRCSERDSCPSPPLSSHADN